MCYVHKSYCDKTHLTVFIIRLKNIFLNKYIAYNNIICITLFETKIRIYLNSSLYCRGFFKKIFVNVKL